ncbi:glycosyltransferase family 4 protein [Pseudomaricurvus sp. HS19]|uniref:glycosyltransferase family 4 protein n=1 Tax=Pseudomaricurvus sp. HS19 TaxID=2692626 RepID=UPI0013709747|nr:glycosyltransferase family 4 protein [Pseudomaricurvus sp. HS19]MYM62869.1 glycosyltransferase [Pseudomaricurvus sp. HS19]
MNSIDHDELYSWLDEDSSRSAGRVYKVPLGVQFLFEYRSWKIISGLESESESESEAELMRSYFFWCAKLSDVYPEMRWDLPPAKILDFLNSRQLSVVCETVCQALTRTSTSIICAVLISSRADDILRWLSKPSPACADKIPLALYHIWLSRPDLKKHFNLSRKEGCEKFLNWWSKFGGKEYEFIQYSPDLDDGLKFSPLVRITDHILRRSTASELELAKKLLCSEIEGAELLPFQSLIAKDRPDLILTKTGGGLGLKDALETWWESSGAYELKSLHSIVTKEKALSPPSSKGGSVSGEFKSADRPGAGEKEGVNIIGYPFGMLGLGEDARQMGLCLSAAGIECALIEAPIKGPKRLIELDPSTRVIDNPEYQVSVFCLPPTDMIRLGLEGGRDFVAASGYRIGAWPWELPEWPERYCQILHVVDEIWAQSEYVANCFRRLGHPNVVKMPMGVTLTKAPDRCRERWGFSNEDFIFYATFDGNSFITRKNPVAVVKAFLKAFSMENCGDLNVCLLIKAINVREDVYWSEILTLVAGDPRIVVFTESLNRDDMVDLMATADCYVSLHRSEGFGRGIAEAMLLGQPVVASAFSGNADFCNDDTAFCVAGKVVPVPAGHYLFDDGQYWYDPDLDDAAGKMRLVYNDSELRRVKAANGKAFIEKVYSKEAVARAYKDRIEAVYSNLARSEDQRSV